MNAADRAGYRPLHFACQQGALAAAQLLLEAGAEIDSPTTTGMSPLYLAVTGRNGELVQALRQQGADPLGVAGGRYSPVELARGLTNAGMAQYFEDVAVAQTPAPDVTTRQPSPRAAGSPRADHASAWQEEYGRLWDELVPGRGQVPTVQGELIRCVGRLTDEAYRNGNQNWSAGSGHCPHARLRRGDTAR